MPDMPELPDNVPACHKVILSQWGENIELKAASKHTIGGFMSRNEKLVTGLLTALLMAIGGAFGVTWYTSEKNSQKIDEGLGTQQEIKKTAEATAVKVDDAAVKVQDVDNKVEDVHRAVKKKGPFGE